MQKHILIIDDEQSIRELCKEFLEEEGYKVTLAVDGQDGLDKMNYDEFDLYMVDMVMPRLDGLETMKSIKKKQPLAVIIITTGYSSIDGAVKAVHAGAFQYLSKPINAEELLEAVKKGLKYGEDLYGPLQVAFDTGTESKKGEPAMLRGFTKEEKDDFISLGRIHRFEAGQNITLDDVNLNSIILVESGELSVWLSNTSVDYLRKNDTWAEENFILASSFSPTLRTETACNIRFFDRNKLLDFFAYKGERLMKRFMINLINCIFSKWRKSIQRIVMLKLVTGDR